MLMRRALYFFASFALLGSMLIAAEDDPFAGTWKLDPAKSSYSSNNPMPKDLTLIIADQGANRVLTFKGTAANDSPIDGQITEPVKGGTIDLANAPFRNTFFDKAELKYIGPTANDMVYSKDGKKIATRHIKMAVDRQTFTARYTGPSPQGRSVTQNDFWRRQ